MRSCLTNSTHASTGPRAFTRGLMRATIPDADPKGFNGAARFHARIVVREATAGFASVGFNGAARFHARIALGRPDAALPRYGAALGCFNGAARFHARIAALSGRLLVDYYKLQRGRALSRADCSGIIRELACLRNASTGPRAFTRGLHTSRVPGRSRKWASTGPRAFTRGLLSAACPP